MSSSCEEFGLEAQLQCSFLERPRAVVFCHEAGLSDQSWCKDSHFCWRSAFSILHCPFSLQHTTLLIRSESFRKSLRMTGNIWKPFFLILSESFNVFWQVLLVLTSRQNQPGKSGSAWTAQRGSPTWECDSPTAVVMM